MIAAFSPSSSSAQGGLSSFALKILAIAGMTANHIGYVFYPFLPLGAQCVLFAVGGVTFPIMAFLLVEGYRLTSNVKRYGMRLLVFALISQVPFWLFLAHGGNVLFTLLIGLAALYLYDHLKNRGAFWLIFIALTLASSLCDWGILGPLMILILRVVPNQRTRIVYALLLPIIGTGVAEFAQVIAGDLAMLPFALYGLVGCTAAIPLLLAYNGLRGKPLKWFFYAYYPAHITVLGLACGLIFNYWPLIS